MSEQEGKVPYRKRPVDLIDILYYEATGEMMPPDARKMMNKPVEAPECIDPMEVYKTPVFPPIKWIFGEGFRKEWDIKKTVRHQMDCQCLECIQDD